MLLISQQATLKELFRSETWKALLQLREDLVMKWSESRPNGTTEFDYLSQCLKRDGRIEGVGLFLSEIERLMIEEHKL